MADELKLTKDQKEEQSKFYNLALNATGGEFNRLYILLMPEYQLKLTNEMRKASQKLVKLEGQYDKLKTKHDGQLTEGKRLQKELDEFARNVKDAATKNQGLLTNKLMNFPGVDYDLPVMRLKWFGLKDDKDGGKVLLATGVQSCTFKGKKHEFTFKDGYCVTNNLEGAKGMVMSGRGITCKKLVTKEQSEEKLAGRIVDE